MTGQQQPLCPKLHCCTSQPGLEELGKQQIPLKYSEYLFAINNIGISKDASAWQLRTVASP